MRKYCRICWNTKYWREPTREAADLETGGSYVEENGFGHEEWLFNFSWLQPGPKGTPGKFKYGFLQPISKYYDAYEGKTFDVLVYAVTPTRVKVAAAIIENMYVPSNEELEEARAFQNARGWIDQMRDDLVTLGIPAKKLAKPAINIRFRTSDVRFFDPLVPFPTNHKIYRIDRYQPINWDDNFPGTAAALESRQSNNSKKIKSEALRMRAATDPTEYSPQHDRMQNNLHAFLQKQFGNDAVGYEIEFVDLRLTEPGGVTFFEIKTAPLAKSCIRQALGQLLEYGIYPTKQRCSKFVVVGDGLPCSDDAAYLAHLREKFGIPIFYRRWHWDSGMLEAEV